MLSRIEDIMQAINSGQPILEGPLESRLEALLLGLQGNTGSIPNSNLFINGDFKIWQRGTSFIFEGTRKCTADRWVGLNLSYDNRNTITKTANGAMLVHLATKQGMYISQVVETDYTPGTQITVTLSAKMKLTNGVQAFFNAGPPVDGALHESITGTGDFKVYTVTQNITVAEDSTIYGAILNDPSDICDLEVEWAKLELGNKATPFVSRLAYNELALCQRYFSSTAYDGIRIVGTALTNNYVMVNYKPPQTMRIKPTIVIATGTKVNYIRRTSDGVEFATTGAVAETTWVNNMMIVLLRFTGVSLTAGYQYDFTMALDAEI